MIDIDYICLENIKLFEKQLIKGAIQKSGLGSIGSKP